MRNLYNLCKAWYRLDDKAANTVVWDSMGFSNGTSSRNTNMMSVSSKLNRALQYNGTDYIDSGNTFQNIFRDSYAISLWCITDNSNFSQQPVLFGVNAEKMISAVFNSNGTLTFYFGDTYSTTTNEAVFGSQVSRKFLTFVGTQIDSTHYRADIYVNGMLAMSSGTVDYTFSDFTALENLFLGAIKVNETIYSDFNGAIDDVMIFDEALTAEEISWLYNNGNGRKDIRMTKIFIGNTANHVGDWQWDDAGASYATSNWIDSEGNKCSKPVNNDIVIFDSRSSAVTDGTARGETGGIRLALLHVRSSCTANIASSDEYLHLEADAIIFEGKGTMYLKCSAANQTTDSSIAKVIIRNSTGVVYLASDINTANYSSVFGTIETIRSNLNITNSTIVGQINAIGDNNIITIGTNCVNVKDSNARINIYQTGGIITSGSEIGEVVKTGGTLNASLSITNIQLSGGVCNYEPADSEPVISEGRFSGGTFKATGANNFQFGSNADEKFYVSDSATLDFSSYEGQVGYSSGSELIVIGTGTVKGKSGSEMNA